MDIRLRQQLEAEIGSPAATGIAEYLDDPCTPAVFLALNRQGIPPVKGVSDFIVDHLPELTLSDRARTLCGKAVRDRMWSAHQMVPTGKARVPAPARLSTGALYGPLASKPTGSAAGAG